MYRNKTVITYLLAYLFAISTALRGLTQYRGQSSQWIVYGLLALFFVLMIIEPWLSRRSHRYTHIYLGAQTIVVALLLLLPPDSLNAGDYFAVMCISLVVQALYVLPPRIGFRWIGIFSVVAASLLIHKYGWDVGVPFAIQYPVAYLFIGAFMATTRQAETARRESQQLLAELQATYAELQIYTAQAEELAAIEERNRLARDLHDSVTQTIFSITLNAQAAQMLLERDPLSHEELATQIQRLQEQSQSALVEMRSLIYQLRPAVVAEEGLIAALRKHIAGLERRKGLQVDLQTNDEKLLLSNTHQQELFRVVQEALNNVTKHAQTDHASVILTAAKADFRVMIEDHGRGFAPEGEAGNGSGMGLRSMRERVAGLGGTIHIESSPGSGTRICVSAPMGKEKH